MSKRHSDAMKGPPTASHIPLATPVAGAMSTNAIGFGICHAN